MLTFTPLNEDGTERLKIEPENIEVLTGDLFQRGPGVHATVRIGGETFDVEGRVCSAGHHCFCDAQLVKVDFAGSL